MSFIKQAFKGAMWLSLFRAISQIFSWAATVIVARILVPQDYGLMGMATILTGYVALFSELGLGTAIIQREEVKEKELSSLFWFIVFWGFILALVCIILAYPTVAIFNEKRILRVTQSIALLFIIGSFLIVPLNILQRELRFKAIGFIDATSVIVSCLMMIIIAKLGGEVWTLIGGYIIRQFVRVILVFFIISWRPKLHFDFIEIKSYLKFGLNIAGAGSLEYICSRSAIFFGGKALGAHLLGFYSFASQLALIPRDKIVSLINQVAFPIFSKYQKNYAEFNQFYLRVTKLIALITFPLFIGGFFTANLLIPIVLGEKWIPIISLFKMFCIHQLIVCLTIPSGTANNAQNRPHWGLYVNIANAIFLPLSFYIAAKYGLYALAIPWVTIHPLIRLGFTWITIKKLGISVFEYIKNLMHPFLATISMVSVLYFIKYASLYIYIFSNLKFLLILMITSGIISYFTYILAFQKHILIFFWNMRKA